MAAKEPKRSGYTLLGCMQAVCKSNHDYDFQLILALLRINLFFERSKKLSIQLHFKQRNYFK
ncbi:hypothetical protein DP116_14880 [Brasilonema bromeliae SPC951]|uniref:Uncharacterized protein n=1 Tax=Brasilonema bromeliae SPC951 TaxID=385972 RepID=A0ABX1PB57_9CYAN|nr:hypothetical protein [Brasilonema bromeliae SPC951]